VEQFFGDGGFTPQAGEGEDGEGGIGIMDTVTNNPAITLGAGAALVYF